MPSWSSRDKYFWAARRQYDDFILSSRLSRGSFHHAGQEARNENDSNSDTESDMGNVGNPVIDAGDLSRQTFVGCAVTAAATVTATAMPQPTSAFGSLPTYSDRVGVWRSIRDVGDVAQQFSRYEAAFSLRFFEYLSRILLSYDPVSSDWWERKSREIPRAAASENPLSSLFDFPQSSDDDDHSKCQRLRYLEPTGLGHHFQQRWLP